MCFLPVVRGHLAVNGDFQAPIKHAVAELGSTAEDFELGLRRQLHVDLRRWFGALRYHLPDGRDEKARDQNRCQVTPHDMAPFRRHNTPRTAASTKPTGPLTTRSINSSSRAPKLTFRSVVLNEPTAHHTW